MGLWNAVVNGFGSTEGIAGNASRVDGLCASLGWRVHRETDGSRSVYFLDAIGKRRRVGILEFRNSVVGFVVFSDSLLPAAEVPRSVIDHLILRNDKVVSAGAWAAHVCQDGSTLLYFHHCAFGDGLTGQRVTQICETLIGEVCTFDGRLRQAGLLTSG